MRWQYLKQKFLCSLPRVMTLFRTLFQRHHPVYTDDKNLNLKILNLKKKRKKKRLTFKIVANRNMKTIGFALRLAVSNIFAIFIHNFKMSTFFVRNIHLYRTDQVTTFRLLTHAELKTVVWYNANQLFAEKWP